MAKLTKAAQAERAEAIDKLKGWLKPGDTVYTVLDHVSTSGMRRAIRVVLLTCDEGRVTDTHPNYAIGTALGLRHWVKNGHRRDALVMDGCGMDMGFALVYALGRTLYPDGYGCHGANCYSNDHSNGRTNRTPHRDEPARCVVCSDGWPCRVNLHPDSYTPAAYAAHQPAPPATNWHNDGGYAFRHQWL